MEKSNNPDDTRNLRVSRTVWLNVKLRAAHEGITMRELVERALHQALMAPMLGPMPPRLIAAHVHGVTASRGRA